MAKKPQPMTSDFVWQDVSQVRIGVSVSKAIEKWSMIRHDRFTRISLADWKLVEVDGKHAIRHIAGFHSAYYPHKLSDSTVNCVPVLVGEGNGKKFLIDGPHRMARRILEGKKTIPAAILTEAETLECVRDGQLERFQKFSCGHSRIILQPMIAGAGAKPTRNNCQPSGTKAR